MKKLILYINTLFIALLLTSCGDSDFDSTTSLNSQQQNAMAQLLLMASLFPSEGFIFVGLEEDIDDSIDCPISGTMDVKGVVNYEVNEQQEEFDGTFDLNEVVFTDCVIETASEEEMTVNGTLEVKTDTVIESFNDGEEGILTGSFDSEYKGSLEVSGDEVENGTCGINIDSIALIAEFYFVGEFSGNLCGTDYDRVVPFLDL
ncbi:hypothetical protein MRY82_02830 [bacterium]|nr:hypothetical protein [bacterium]